MDISPAFSGQGMAWQLFPSLSAKKKKLDDYLKVKINKNIKYCQKMEQYSILSACIDVYYDISSAVICPKGKISKQTWWPLKPKKYKSQERDI